MLLPAVSSATVLVQVVIALVFVCVIAVVLRRRAQTRKPMDYERTEGLLTPCEKEFFTALNSAVGERYHILAKVRLADIVQPRSDLPKQAWQAARNRMDRNHADFVLCDPATLAVVCVVELSDAAHSRPGRRERDAFMHSVLEKCGVPMATVAAHRDYDVATLRTAVQAALSGPAEVEPSSATTIITGRHTVEDTQILPPDYQPDEQPAPQPAPRPMPTPRSERTPTPRPRTEPTPTPRPRPERTPTPRPRSERTPMPQPKPTPMPTPTAGADADAPICPECGSPMQLRKARRGRTAGSSFWGCSRYPDCRGKRPADGQS